MLDRSALRLRGGIFDNSNIKITTTHMWPILSQQTEAGSPSEDKDVWEDEDEDEEQNMEENDGTLIDVTTLLIQL